MSSAPTAGLAANDRPAWRLLANFAAFQLGWFACVLGAAHGVPAAGTAVAAVIVALHIGFATRPIEELKLIAIAVGIGAVFDSALAASGWVGYPTGTLIPGAAPHWILALWALFAMTLNASLDWLQGRWKLAAILGAVAGPLSYWGGARLGALDLVEFVPALAALSIGWALIMPALLTVARRYNGMSKVPA